MAFEQFRILLYKNFLLRRRQPILFLFELVWPLLLFSIVAIIRRTSPVENRPACHYNPMPLPNSGTISFLKSFLCNTNVSCRLKAFDMNSASLKDDITPVYDNFQILARTPHLMENLENIPRATEALSHINNALNDTFLQKLIDGQFFVRDLFTNTNIFEKSLLATGMPPHIITGLLNASFDFVQIYKTFNDTVDFEPVCSQQLLINFLTIDGINNSTDVIQVLCSLELKDLLMDMDYFLSEIDNETVINYFQNISRIFTGEEIQSKIDQLMPLFNNVDQLTLYAKLFKNMPNMNEIITIIPKLIRIIELMQNHKDMLILASQILGDLYVVSGEKIIHQLYEITHLVIDILQRYDNMSQSLTTEQLFSSTPFFQPLFNNRTFNMIIQTFLTVGKIDESHINTSRINYATLAEFIVGNLTTTNHYHLFCTKPGFWSLFILDRETEIVLKTRVQTYCGSRNNIEEIYRLLMISIRFEQLFLYYSDMTISPLAIEGIKNIFITMSNMGTLENDVRLAMEGLSAVSLLLSKTKVSGLNLLATYTFLKQMIETFNPNLVKGDIFNFLNTFIPIASPFFNIDNIISTFAGIPPGTIDNIVNNLNQLNNILTTPPIVKLVPTTNRSLVTTVKNIIATSSRMPATYVNWSALSPVNWYPSGVYVSKTDVPKSLEDYSLWLKRQKRQINILGGLSSLLGQNQNVGGPIVSNLPGLLSLFNGISPDILQTLCIIPIEQFLPKDDPVLSYIFGAARLLEIINNFITMITSTNKIQCFNDPNKDYQAISTFLRLNNTAGLIRELIQNGFKSTFSCSLIIDVIKNIQLYQNLVQTLQQNTITIETLNCLQQTLLQTLERLKTVPGLLRFIFDDGKLISVIKQVQPLLQILQPMLAGAPKFVQLNDMIDNSKYLTTFINSKHNMTSLEKWYFNTRLSHSKSFEDWSSIFCNVSVLQYYLVSFDETLNDIVLSLCRTSPVYTQAYKDFMMQYNTTIQLKRFAGLDILRIIEEIPSITNDFNSLYQETQWFSELLNKFDVNGLPADIYKQFVEFTSQIENIEYLQYNMSKLVEKYFWALPDEDTQLLFLGIINGLKIVHDVAITLKNSFSGLPLEKVFKSFSKIMTKLSRDYKVPPNIIRLLQSARLFKDPLIVFNIFSNFQTTVCNPSLLNDTIHKAWPYLKFDKNFDYKTLSDFACSISFDRRNDVIKAVVKHFLLPDKLKMFAQHGGGYLKELMNLDGDEVYLFRQVEPIMKNINQLIARVEKLNHGDAINSDEFSQIQNIFCAEEDRRGEPSLNRQAIDQSSANGLLGTMNSTNPKTDDNNNDNPVDCQDIQRKIQNGNDLGYIIWPLLKPLLVGKILYAPATAVSHRIIEKVNKTFEELDKLHQFARAWVNSQLNLTLLSENVQNTNNIKKVLSNQLFQELIGNIVDMNSYDLNSIMTMLESFSGSKNEHVLHNVESLMRQFANYLPCLELNRFEAFETEGELVERAQILHRNRLVLAGIVFSNLNSSNGNYFPPHIHIKIRMDVDSVRTTEQLRSWLFVPGPETEYFREMHYLRGFIQLQDLIERAVIDLHFDENPSTKPNPTVYMQLMPYPCYKGDQGKESAYVNYFILPILGTLMWTATLGVSIKNLMRERERNVERTMKIMGLSSSVNFISWLISSILPMIFVSIIVAVVLKYGGIFPASDLSIVITTLLILAISALMLGYLVSSFFTKANLATLCGILVYFISYLPFILVMFLEAKMQLVQKIFICLSAATAFGYSSVYLTRFEYQGEGLQWSGIFKSIIPNDSMNFFIACVMMLVDSLIYGLIGQYIRSIFPGKNGTPKPFYYPFLPSTWRCGAKAKAKKSFHITRETNPYIAKIKQIDPNNEKEPEHLPVGIALTNLTKQFGKDKIAIQNLSINFYEEHITALLGHNGAGKTTTINVLTGIYAPTSGNASIYGRDITTDYEQIRKNVGLCPQDDILFDFMTVREHLNFYGKLKGNMSSKELDRDVNELLSSMGLWLFQHERVLSLSGGVRRRVSVAIAFVAGSKTVILDEPTSGVDPCARRSIWEVIFKHRTGRTILLTTHYLDEADTLSDRIAIVHQGRVLCSGSPMFLKKRFGKGYSLTIDLKLKMSKNKEVDPKPFKNLHDFIIQEIPDATIREQMGTEITYCLQLDQRTKFQQFFKQIEINKELLLINNYGLSDTTLEEVFLWVTELADRGKMEELFENGNVNKSTEHGLSSSESDDSGLGVDSNGTLDGVSSISDGGSSGSTKQSSSSITTATTPTNASLTKLCVPTRRLVGKKLYFQQFQALFLKRIHHTKRNWKVFISHIILPLIFVAMSMGFTLVRPSQSYQRSLLMTPAMYDPSNMFTK